MGLRIISGTAVLGIALATAVGPGLTLTRCLITGEVTLSCCCQGTQSPRHGSTADEPDACCSFEHLKGGWPTAQRSARPELVWSAVGIATPLAGHALGTPAPERLRPEPMRESPPLWRSALRI